MAKKYFKYFIGIDSGSTMCKTVLSDGEKIIDAKRIKTGWNPEFSATGSLETLLEKNKVCRSDVCIATTGYGRGAINFADYSFTEITCHAFGGMALVPEISGVIDIGGQDSKVIQIRDKKIVHFLMNDKCAAGTGRFLSMACETLGINIEEIDEFADQHEAISVNSMCTVFAESEIISLLSMQKDRAKIMTGVLNSIAQKIWQMISKLDFEFELKEFRKELEKELKFEKHAPLLMTGGLSQAKTLINIISQTIGFKVITHENALFAGALGACVCAKAKYK